MLWGTVFDEICPYGHGAARGTHLGVFERWGGRNRACDGGRLASTFGVIHNELQRSVSDEIRQCGGSTTHRKMMWHWFGMARPPMARWRARAAARISLYVDQNLM
jgi:hypothetical protein